MKDIVLVGEDVLCCELGKKLLDWALPDWSISGTPINKKGITRLLPELSRYAECARHVRPVLCIADTDGSCPVELRKKWYPPDAPKGLLLGLAVPEAESWILADGRGVAQFFNVPIATVPTQPEGLKDAKAEVLRIASLSRRAVLRTEMLATGRKLRPGSGYNHHLSRLVADAWNLERAIQKSDSLRRAIAEVAALQTA